MATEPERFEVWRRDDNGNEFRLAEGLNRAEAEALVKAYEAKGHKQVYWLRPERRNRSAD